MLPKYPLYSLKKVILMGMSLSHLLIVLVVVLILFGAGKLPQVLKDLGKGVKNFRDEVKKEDSSSEKN
jgi:sec-independent protein translocase protein TatA